MKIIETHPREKGFVLWGHCQNILDDPRISNFLITFEFRNNHVTFTHGFLIPTHFNCTNIFIPMNYKLNVKWY